jgi:hypothetical protein
MRAQRMLWRLDDVTVDGLTSSEQLAGGLAQHLARSDLHTVLMQISDRQQAYVGLDGCSGCARGRCEIGCHVDLLRRLLKACGGQAAELRPVVGGLATRRYTRLVVAIPTRRARLLDGELLNAWPEARLTLHWRGVRVAALLLVGADGPGPATIVREWGWRGLSVPVWVVRRWVCRPMPPALRWSGRWRGVPTLLLPATGRDAEVEATEDDVPRSTPLVVISPDRAEVEHNGNANGQDGIHSTARINSQEGTHSAANSNGQDGTHGAASANGDRIASSDAFSNGRADRPTTDPTTITTVEPDDAALASWVREAIVQARQREASSAPSATIVTEPMSMVTKAEAPTDVTVDAADADDASPWPTGPGGLRPAVLADLITRLTSDSAFTQAPQVSQIGVVKGRLTKVLDLPDELAAALMVWLDAAGVLADPYRPDDRWRKPRRLVTTDLDQIAERLRVTPLPDAAAIQAAYGGAS